MTENGGLHFDLKDKRAIVTGGSRGIGREACLKLAKAGAKVAVVATKSEGAQPVVDEIRGAGGVADAFGLDVADTSAVNQMVDQVVSEWGGVDILVNNAGITRDGLVMRMSDEDFDRVLSVDLRGVFAFSRAVTRPMMKAKGGRIINITSIVGLMGNAGQANYAAAKAGVVGLTKSMAKELSGRGITVNAIAPGFIETDMTQDLPDEVKKASLSAIPVGRFGKPDDISFAILYLASDIASFITGQTLVVDGGMYI